MGEQLDVRKSGVSSSEGRQVTSNSSFKYLFKKQTGLWRQGANVWRRLSHFREYRSGWHHCRSLPTHSTQLCSDLHDVQADFSTSPNFLVVLWSWFQSTFLRQSYREVLQVNETELLRKIGHLSHFGRVTIFATLTLSLLRSRIGWAPNNGRLDLPWRLKGQRRWWYKGLPCGRPNL